MESAWDRLYRVYDKMPNAVREPLRPFISSSLTLRWFVTYLFIGLSGVAFYLVLLAAFLRLGIAPLAATALTYVITASVQFLLNRNANFRAFDRPIVNQASTYAIVATLIFLLTLALVDLGVHVFGLTPFLANLLTLVVTCPLAYLGTRYFTFGPGIAARIREWLQ